MEWTKFQKCKRANKSAEEIAEKFGVPIEQARIAVNQVNEADLWKNNKYQVAIRRNLPSDGAGPAMLHLSIKRLDQETIHDWRDLQRIKNELVGEEYEAVELYPAESRLVDAANQYHLWVIDDPKFRWPIGFTERVSEKVRAEQNRGVEMDKRVIEKIQKLLALATSSNEHEAKLAAERANELLVKHNLSMQQVERSITDDYEGVVLVEKSEASIEDKWVMSILQRHFFVNPVKERVRKEKITRYHLVGEKTNVEVARYVYGFLIHQFKALWKQYKTENMADEKSRQSYYSGLYQGLNQQLEAKRKGVEQEAGLVVVEDPNLQKVVRSLIGKVSQTKYRVNLNDSDAMDAGEEKGKTLRISRGLESHDGSSGRYLK